MGLFPSRWQNTFQLFAIFNLMFCFVFTLAMKTKTTMKDGCLPATFFKKEKIFTIVPLKIFLPIVFSVLKHIQITGIELNI